MSAPLVGQSDSAVRGYYFGTFRRPGHHLHREGDPYHHFHSNGSYGEDFRWAGADDLPWHRIDGKLNPSGKEGECAVHYKDGWTALAFSNYADDKRPGSNSVFVLPGTLTFEQAVAEAQRRFPYVVEKLPFALWDTAA